MDVTGRSYRLGDIGVGKQKSIKVQPTGESDVEVSFAGSNGQLVRVAAGCYFEANNYSGTIVIDIADDKLVHVENNVSTSVFF